MTVRLIGGEMVAWSDLDGRHGPGPVRGTVLAPLLATATGRTLVAGPHDPALLDALPATGHTVLVRGVPDAEALADRYADRPDVTVCCGGLEKLAPQPPYDTVVALDGVARLSSVEGVELSWEAAFELLLAALRPGGRLLLGVENLLGLHRLVALPPEPTDSDWVVADEYDATRPAGMARVVTRLRGAGLRVTRAYAAFPAPHAPTALLDTGVLADERLHGFLAAAVRRACAPQSRVLTDPGRLAVGALRHGAAAELAPAWVLVARRDGSGPAGAAPAADPLPAALLAGGATREEIRRDGVHGWVRCRDGATGGDPVPVGRTLEDLLLGACLRRDLPQVRELLRGWQAGAAAGCPADQTVAGPGGDLTPLAPAGEPAAALRRFAATLIRGGFAHPWPAPADEAELTLTLAATAGRPLDPATPVADDGPGPNDAGSDGAGSLDASRPRSGTVAVRELAAERDRLARELAEARAKAAWYERTLTAREDALKRAQRLVALLRTQSATARAGGVLLGAARAVWRTARVAARRRRE